MNSLLEVVVGDGGGDGHSVSDTFIISSNKSVEETRAAYEAAKAIVPEDFQPTTICQWYEEDTLESEFYDKLYNYYFKDHPNWVGSEEVGDYNGEIRVEPSWMADIVCAFIGKGNADIEVKIFPVSSLTQDVIGYGLYR